LKDVEEYIQGLPAAVQGTLAAHIVLLQQGEFSAISTKQLKGVLRELIVGDHRLVYFAEGSALYFVDALRKKGRKTPSVVIANAERIYKLFKQS